MMRRRVTLALALAAATAVIGPLRAARVPVAADALPGQLSDKEFWALSEQFSEQNGYFQSDNILSNEIYYQAVIPELLRRAKQGAVYLGVGPEQNFTYIAALHPKLVFITDIRRGNLDEQLLYKALFELSADRAEFVSRLFSKKRPDGLTATSSASELVNAYWDINTSDDLYKANLQAVDDLLTKKHGLPLSSDDLKGIEYVYYQFYWFGPLINYSSSAANGRGGGSFRSYADLIVADDGANVNRGYLGSEAAFQTVKDLETKNLIVPVVGNFAGPKALRAEGKWLKEHQAVVAAFYLSNVEQYLNQDGIWPAFCANVASLPLDASSTFIRSERGAGGFGGGGLVSTLGPMLEETRSCAGY